MQITSSTEKEIALFLSLLFLPIYQEETLQSEYNFKAIKLLHFSF